MTATTAAAPSDENAEVSYRSKGVEGAKTGRLAMKMMLIGMPCMFAALALSGGNAFVGAIGLVVPIFWMASRKVQHLECGVSAAGIRETWLVGKGEEAQRREQIHPWSSVASWMVEEDQFRDVGTRRFAEIRFRGGHRIRFRAGDGADSQEAFENFAAAMEKFARPAAGPAPRRRLIFYRRPIGKVVTVLLSLLTVGLVYAGVVMPEYFPESGWWKISAVMVPGCAYMIWRSFLQR